jgi:uncharacterized protein
MGSLRGAIAACAVVTSSCGGAQRADAPKPAPALEVKTYAPLGAKADSKAPDQAVILGTDAKDGSTILPLPVGAARANVDALFVRLAEPIQGGMSGVKLSTGPNAERSVQVGIYEELAGGTGPQWRAGVWISAIVASTTLNKDLTDFTFSAASGGYVDGASASALMAAGFLAALTGQTVDPTATMTGTINPDGTVGPVAGIPEKFKTAIERGKKRIGYPIGLRMAASAKTGGVIDLEALAKEHGAVAVEIADVHQAYQLLTGKPLPAPLPVSEQEMALDDATIKALDAKYKQWQQRLATEYAAILQLETAGRMPRLLVFMRDYSKTFAESAEDLKKRGLHAAAYARMFAATLYAQTANQAYDILSRVQAGKVSDAIALVARHDNLPTTTRDVFTKVGAMRPPTMGGHLQMLAAFRAALRAWVFESFATQAVATAKAHLQTFANKPIGELGSDQTAESIVQVIVPTLLYVGKTLAETTLATEQLEVQNVADINYMCSIPNVRRMATSYHSAGAAGIHYFEALLMQPFAASAKLSEEEARRRIALAEPDYLVGFMASRLGGDSADATQLPAQLKAQWGESSLPWGLLSLAGSQLAYFHAAELIAKYSSLNASVASDGSGRVEKVEHEKAFAFMLDNAERSARASARAARIATGSIPVQAKLAYQNATVERDGSLGDKLGALSQYWASSAYSQTAVMLARN